MYFVVERMQVFRPTDSLIQAAYVSLWLPRRIWEHPTLEAAEGAASYAIDQGRRKNLPSPPRFFIIPELEHIKRAALGSLASANSRRAYKHAID